MTILCLIPVCFVQELDRLQMLDASQREALQQALTQRVALVQGPPGTGKTFIGVQLCDILYRCTQGKILIVCYTNHALDQFLEALLAKGIKDIVRIGARSKSKALEPYNLRQLAGGGPPVPGQPPRATQLSQAERRLVASRKQTERETLDDIKELVHQLWAAHGKPPEPEEGSDEAAQQPPQIRPLRWDQVVDFLVERHEDVFEQLQDAHIDPWIMWQNWQAGNARPKEEVGGWRQVAARGAQAHAGASGIWALKKWRRRELIQQWRLEMAEGVAARLREEVSLCVRFLRSPTGWLACRWRTSARCRTR